METANPENQKIENDIERVHTVCQLIFYKWNLKRENCMGRLHLMEIEDETWCPHFIREATTDMLLGLYNLLHIYEPAYEKINEVLEKTQVNTIIDCCSGSGGPMKQLRSYLDKAGKESVTITLTDKYPNVELYKQLEASYANKINGHPQSLDATQLLPSLKGMRTFFSSFHHFKPKSALKILQDAVNNNAPIGIFESVHRTPMDFIRAFTSPILVPFIIPFAKRMTWRKFIFTYLLPITPFTFAWDYIASNMRAYSIKEMHALIKQLDAPGYQWEIGKMWSKKAACYVYYLVGYKTLSTPV